MSSRLLDNVAKTPSHLQPVIPSSGLVWDHVLFLIQEPYGSDPKASSLQQPELPFGDKACNRGGDDALRVLHRT